MKPLSTPFLVVGILLHVNVPLIAFNAATWGALWLLGYESIWMPTAMLAASLVYMQAKIVAGAVQKYRAIHAVARRVQRTVKKVADAGEEDDWFETEEDAQ